VLSFFERSYLKMTVRVRATGLRQFDSVREGIACEVAGWLRRPPDPACDRLRIEQDVMGCGPEYKRPVDSEVTQGVEASLRLRGRLDRRVRRTTESSDLDAWRMSGG
jgi:hypothetical protein